MQRFLDWLDKWEERIDSGLIGKKIFSTDNTSQGLRITVRSTIDLSNYLLKSCKLDYLLTGKINQDSLEV